MSTNSPILIVGGGAMGLFSAYYLSKEHSDITLIEQSEVGDENACSFGNAGFVSPSHIIPLAAPGMILKGLKWMMDPLSPFFIKPKADLHLMNWLWLFFRSANKKKAHRSSFVLKALGELSQTLYHELVEEIGNPMGYREEGLLMPYLYSEGEKECHALIDQLRKVGLSAKILDRSEAMEIEPDLTSQVKGAAFFPMDAHLNPGTLLLLLRDHLKKKGVRIRTEERVSDFDMVRGRISRVRTTRGSYTPETVIFACGAYSARLMRSFGVYIPLQAAKGYSVTLNHDTGNRRVPMLLCESKIAVTPFDGKLRIAGTLELAGLDKKINERRVHAILRRIHHYLRIDTPTTVEKEAIWAGLRPCSPDGLPYIGRLKQPENAILATGHAMMGITLGPVSGKLVAEMAMEGPLSLNTDALKVDRFPKPFFHRL